MLGRLPLCRLSICWVVFLARQARKARTSRTFYARHAEQRDIVTIQTGRNLWRSTCPTRSSPNTDFQMEQQSLFM